MVPPKNADGSPSMSRPRIRRLARPWLWRLFCITFLSQGQQISGPKLFVFLSNRLFLGVRSMSGSRMSVHVLLLGSHHWQSGRFREGFLAVLAGHGSRISAWKPKRNCWKNGTKFLDILGLIEAYLNAKGHNFAMDFYTKICCTFFRWKSICTNSWSIPTSCPTWAMIGWRIASTSTWNTCKETPTDPFQCNIQCYWFGRHSSFISITLAVNYSWTCLFFYK